MRKIVTLFLLITSVSVFAQHTFTHGNHSLEIGGWVGVSYTRVVSSDPDKHKNLFALEDARLELDGYVKSHFRYKLLVNFADLSYLFNGIAALDHTPLLDAHITYTSRFINIRAGYMKLPYSQASAESSIDMPFLQRAEMARGDVFSRRDAGLMVFKDFWHQRINLYAGVYTGLGEQTLLGRNDINGKLEYVGRVEFSYPGNYRDNEVDKMDLQKPTFRVGGNARYAEKSAFLNGNDDYNIKTIDGKKITYGTDVAFMWHGFSAQFEFNRAHMIPRANTPLANELKLYNTSFKRAGGYLVQMNYYIKWISSAVALRYDEYNPNDLTVGDTRRNLSVAYNFFYPKYNLAFKFQYWYRFKQQKNDTKWDDDRFRFAAQYAF